MSSPQQKERPCRRSRGTDKPYKLQTPLAGPLRIVALVGVDGSGKTTQARRLANWLTESGNSSIYAPNAGGRRWLGRLARRVGRSSAQQLLGIGGMLLVESLLRGLAIGRALLCARLRHRVAVMDRYTVCQYASIRAHRRWHWRQGLGERLARAMYRLFPEPDVTFLLDVDPTEAYRRIEARGTDHENLDFLISSSQAYHELPEAKDFVLIDANSEADEVTHAILAVLTAANCPRKT